MQFPPCLPLFAASHWLSALLPLSSLTPNLLSWAAVLSDFDALLDGSLEEESPFFDWYRDWDQLGDKLKRYIEPGHSLMMLGCGNSGTTSARTARTAPHSSHEILMLALPHYRI